MKQILILYIMILALPNWSFSSPLTNAFDEELNKGNSNHFSAYEIRERLQKLEGTVDFTYNEVVGKYIKQYLFEGRRVSELIIGRSQLYFPIFEHYLQANDMPDELKYLSIVESVLDPNALSPVGAAGLWQFMKGTGMNYGLKIDSYIDERMDPIKSTEMAFRYLADLHKRYDDWTLAIAAYNCGPGRVNRAIRSSQSRDFWKIRPFLPKETRNYVPYFIAAAYMMNFYENHGIKPRQNDFEFGEIKTIRVFEGVSFHKLSQRSGISTNVISKLNPGYRRQFIPQSKYGNYLTLPDEGMMRFKNHLQKSNINTHYNSDSLSFNESLGVPPNTIGSSYVVQKGETLNIVAQMTKCDVEDLIAWNKLAPNRSLFFGQELLFYLPKEKLNPPKPKEPIVVPITQRKKEELPQALKPKRVLYHFVKEGETLKDIIRYYPDVTTDEIIQQNHLQPNMQLALGAKLRIKEL